MSNESINAADRILMLHTEIRSTFSKPLNGNQYSQRPLHEALTPIAKAVGFSSSTEMMQTLHQYCDSAESGVRGLRLKRESARKSYSKAISSARSVFEAENFGTSTAAAFNKSFSPSVIDTIGLISERLEDQDISEASLDDVRDALAAAEDLFKGMCDEIGMSGRAKALFRLHFGMMTDIVETFERFGEQDFWNHYRVTFAAFFELQAGMQPEQKARFTERLSIVFRYLVDGSTLGANSAALIESGKNLTLLLSAGAE